MNTTELKKWLYENNKVEELLSELGCHSIKYHSGHYWTCGNPDGDNKTSISIYAPSLNVVNYTRTIPQPSDIFTLIEYIKSINFFQSLKYVCDLFGVDYYKEVVEDQCQSMLITKMLRETRLGIKHDEDEDIQVKQIPESVLSYYHTPCVNDMFLRDGIDYKTQVEFQIGYDDESSRITIPIRDEIGNLVSVKGRLFKDVLGEDDLKYIYLYKCPRNRILFGLDKTHDFIKQEGRVFVSESEKGTTQLWSYGYKNSVGIGGKKISKIQVEKIVRLAVEVVLAFDQDVSESELNEIAEMFPEGFPVWAIIDKNGILSEKQSPMDDRNKWEILVKEHIYRIR